MSKLGVPFCLAVVFSLGACGATTPTAVQPPTQPRATGVMFGSGNRAGTGDAPTRTTAPADSVQTTASSGGVMFGSGN
jgi:hypothetical protein